MIHDPRQGFDGDEGRRRRDEALDRPETYRQRYVLRGRRVLLERLLDSPTATADDVRRAIEMPPGLDPACFGAVPLGLAKAGIIRRVGFTPTERAMAHYRPLSIWTRACQPTRRCSTCRRR